MSTHTAISYHIVFSTKKRTPALKRERREDLFRYLWGIIKNRRSHLYRINGVEDHALGSLSGPSRAVTVLVDSFRRLKRLLTVSPFGQPANAREAPEAI